MAYIKRMVMHGFKSFANKTEISFDKGINVIIGPNGSGKSNISDALCFVLGRLSTKSIRAAKAKNLLFMGSKYTKPSREAMVELVFDNSDRTFGIDKEEIALTRTVRKNGLSIYKINGETKTRADVIETLAQAGIDPHGFNLILQGQIQAAVAMHPEDRRKVIEEVAGISIYESRKQKSIHELEKTDERLKEINAILREKTAFLRNLENERQQALKFKETELSIRRCKASLLTRQLEDKDRELESIQKSVEEKTSQKDKIRNKIEDIQKKLEETNERVSQINKHIQHATGVEQESLHNQISTLKAEIEGLKARRENFENRRDEIKRRIDNLVQHDIPSCEREISDFKKESPLVAKKQAELEKKKQERAKIEEERKQIYAIKTELNSLKDRIKDKESQKSRINGESDAVLKQIEEYTRQLIYADMQECKNSISELSNSLHNERKNVLQISQNELESTRKMSIAENEMMSAEKIKTQVGKLDICPLCRSKITSDHISHVNSDADEKIKSARESYESERNNLANMSKDRALKTSLIEQTERKLRDAERELARHTLLNEKKEYLKRLVDQDKLLERDMKILSDRKDSLQQRSIDTSELDDRYVSVLHEIEEISSRSEENLDQALASRSRDLERLKEKLKSDKLGFAETEGEISNFTDSIDLKSKSLSSKEKEEAELSERFKKLFSERNDLQVFIQEKSFDVSTLQGEVRQIEEQINHLRIGIAQIGAKREGISMELGDYSGVELIKASPAIIEERLQKAQASLQSIGSINMRALEIYDEMKTEYDLVQQKVDILVKEKEEIIKIISEIDNKKRRTFMKTFNQINELFGSNFSRLSTKGSATLQLDNPEDLFSGGVSIAIRMGKGKNFDVTSLSGGEKTLVALSLLFAIQEHKPYHFYIFDEIDAALDKRNSERLSALLKQYMRAGQYITITHNDAIIMDANVLYGVSMHEGVSKILSLKVGEEIASKVADILKPNQSDSVTSSEPSSSA